MIYDRSDPLHVSGHACQEELKIIHALTRPKFFIPLHGEQKMLRRHLNLALEMGMNRKNMVLADIGSVIELTTKTIKIADTPAPSGSVLVDGSGVGDVGAAVLRDRKILAEDGMVVVLLNIQHGQLLNEPEIITRGFVYVKESEDMIRELSEVASNAAVPILSKGGRDTAELRGTVKSAISGYLFRHTRRSPMVIPVVNRL